MFAVFILNVILHDTFVISIPQKGKCSYTCVYFQHDIL